MVEHQVPPGNLGSSSNTRSADRSIHRLMDPTGTCLKPALCSSLSPASFKQAPLPQATISQHSGRAADKATVKVAHQFDPELTHHL